MSDNYLTDPRANTIEGWIAALQIFAKYRPKGLQDTLDTCAEHDILFMSTEPSPVGRSGKDEWNFAPEHQEDAAGLRALGFHWSTEGDCWSKFT